MQTNADIPAVYIYDDAAFVIESSATDERTRIIIKGGTEPFAPWVARFAFMENRVDKLRELHAALTQHLAEIDPTRLLPTPNPAQPENRVEKLRELHAATRLLPTPNPAQPETPPQDAA